MAGKYRAYPEYRDSGVEWLGEIPSHWATSYLGFECSVKARLGWKGLKAEEYVNEGYIFLATPNIKDSEIDFANVNYITKERYDESPEIMLEVGDVLVTKDGSTTGTSNVVRSLPRPATVNSSIAVIRSNGKVNPLYLYYFFASEYTQHVIKRMQGGMGVPHLFQADLRKFSQLLPPENEQTNVTKFLDHETAKIDTLIEKQQQLIKLLKEKRQAVISHAVTKGLNPNVPMKDSGVEWLGEVPAHWGLAPLRHLTGEVTVGIVVTPAKYYVDDGVPCFRSLNVRENRIEESNFVYISEESNRELSKSILAEGDILVVRSGQPGTASVVPKKYDGANCIDTIIIRKDERFSSVFMCYQINSDICKRQIESESGGAIQQHFNVEMAKALCVVVPPIHEQEEIAETLSSRLRKLDNLIEKALAAIFLMQERRTALISAAVTGKIDVRDWQPPTTA